MDSAWRRLGLGSVVLVVAVLYAALAMVARRGAEPNAERIVVTQWTLRAGARDLPISIPAHFDRELPAEASQYTLHADVTLTPELTNRDLKIVLPYFTGRVAARVGGQPTVRLGDDLVKGYRARGPQTFHVRAVDAASGVLAIDLVVDHTWTQSGWFDVAPRVIPFSSTDLQTWTVRAINDVVGVIAFATLVQIAITYFAVYMARQRRRAYAYFAVQAFTASFLHLHYLGFTQAVFGRFDVAALSAMIVTATTASVWFTHAQFKLGDPHRIWVALFVVGMVASLFGAGPFLATRVAAKTTVIILTIVIAYQLLQLGKLSRSADKPLGADTVLVSWLVLGAFSIVDGASWLGFGELLAGVKGDCIGLAAFAVLQSALLGREHITSLDRADQLNVSLGQRVAELEARQRENQELNAELQRQITDRSRQLFAALALIGAPRRDAPSLPPGTIVQGRYRVVRPIGQGGMGIVYEVVRVADERQLALKVTRELDSTALARLAREAQIASQVSHPNVVGIVDVDVDPSGFLYLVLEYVDGATLRRLKPKFGNAAWALDVLRQIAEGLEALHAQGVVHRDLKPANVIVEGGEGREPSVKITDFGISRVVVAPNSEESSPVLDDTVTVSVGARRAATTEARDAPTVELPASGNDRPRDAETLSEGIRTPSQPSGSASFDGTSPLTQAGMLVGTPMYMAPELAFDPRLLSPAADVFSLGVMAYELLSDTPAFAKAPALERLEGRTAPPPASIAAHRPELDPDVVELLDACLAFDPLKRPTARALAQVLGVSAIRAARPSGSTKTPPSAGMKTK